MRATFLKAVIYKASLLRIHRLALMGPQIGIILILCIDPVDDLLLPFIGKRCSKIVLLCIIDQVEDKRSRSYPGVKEGIALFRRLAFDQKTHAVDPAGVGCFLIIIQI